jgi:RNA polymerase sigma factor (sigma-70 family)
MELQTLGMRSEAEIFIELRPALLKLAGRILRNKVEAEDIVQEAYLRWAQGGASEVHSPKSYLATVVTRLCLNRLASARVRLEHEDAPLMLERLSSEALGSAEHVELADAVSEAFVIVLGNLSPVERVVFLLREAFEFDYVDIASVVERSEENCRQILKRARARIAAKESTVPPDREQNRRVVSEFLNAAESGAYDGLLRLLSAEAALAPAPSDLSQPAPPLIHDRQLLFQTLRNTLAQMRNVSDGLFIFPVGRDYACVAGSGPTPNAVLLRVVGPKVAGVRLVSCPVLLQELETLVSASTATLI